MTNEQAPSAKQFIQYDEMLKKAYNEVLANREEILKAFIAKHGCEPDEIEIVEQRNDDGLVWFVRRKAPSATVDEKTTAINWLREFLWANHGCHFSHLYGDDGEMSCGICKADFKRYPISELIELYEMKKMEKAKAVTETNLLKAISQQPTVDVDALSKKIILTISQLVYVNIGDDKNLRDTVTNKVGELLQEALRGTYTEKELLRNRISELESENVRLIKIMDGR